MIERSDTTIQKSLRGVGPYGPSGFRLVEPATRRAYSSERPEAGIQNLKFPSEACSSLKEPMGLQSHMGYKLASGVQVREETFGLLFYNYQGLRLYFVPSEDLIPDNFFNGRQSVSELVESICSHNGWPRAGVQDRIIQILIMLEKKGLIRGQSIC
jgi:putative mycofactocin binding protein MftB